MEFGLYLFSVFIICINLLWFYASIKFFKFLLKQSNNFYEHKLPLLIAMIVFSITYVYLGVNFIYFLFS